jgi:hypothetical protein
LVVAVALTYAPLRQAVGQELYDRGQNAAPVFEGWEQNPAGSFELIFGYLNRNFEETLDIPVGPDNSIEPGGPDQGQPTHFLTRRHRFVFRVKVPVDFGKKELVWTLRSKAKTERVYGILKSEYALSKLEIMMNAGGLANAERGEDASNQPPVIKLEGNIQRTVKVGEPLALTALVSDDGLLQPWKIISAPSDALRRRAPRYLRAGWFVYRGAQNVTLDPDQHHPEYQRNGTRPSPPLPPPLPSTGKTLNVTATFSEPGVVVLRLMAHDGGLASSQDVIVTVLPR